MSCSGILICFCDAAVRAASRQDCVLVSFRKRRQLRGRSSYRHLAVTITCIPPCNGCCCSKLIDSTTKDIPGFNRRNLEISWCINSCAGPETGSVLRHEQELYSCLQTNLHSEGSVLRGNTTPMRLGPNPQVHLASLPASWRRMDASLTGYCYWAHSRSSRLAEMRCSLSFHADNAGRHPSIARAGHL